MTVCAATRRVKAAIEGSNFVGAIGQDWPLGVALVAETGVVIMWAKGG